MMMGSTQGKKKAWVYGLLSIFVVYHLLFIVVSPNAQNYLGMTLAPAFNPYLSFFEFSTRWGFFSPDPGPPPVFIEYEIIGENGKSLAAGSWPEKNESYALRERMNRRLSIARYLALDFARAEKMMGNYYCRHFEEAKSVRLWRVYRSLPDIKDVQEKRRFIGDEANSDRKYVGQHLCQARSGA